MPRYDFRCRQCGDTFEVTRPMARSGDPAPCPRGHEDTVKLLSTVALGQVASAGTAAPMPRGGCCGGGCGCG